MFPMPSSALKHMQVRWMTSNNVTCTVEVGQDCKIANVMAQVEEKVGVPVEEQNLFLGARELLAIESISTEDPEDFKLVRAKSDPRNTNLASFHKYVEVRILDMGQFNFVRMIGQGAGASVFRYKWLPSGHEESRDVAVKKVSTQTVNMIQGQETNEHKCHMNPGKYIREPEDPLAEIGILQFLAAQQDVPTYLLRIFDVFEGKHHFWVVTEYADGGDLFDLTCQGDPTEDEIFRFTWQLFQALAYLHQHYIGHRDVSLENLVLKNGTVKLMDFGASVRSHSASGQLLRYFSTVGKGCYRAPECYVPHTAEVIIVAPSHATSNSVTLVTVNNRLVEVLLPVIAVPGRLCTAEVWGYSVPPADTFAAGMCLFMLLFKTRAFESATLEDQYFAQLHYKQGEGLKDMLHAWDIPFPTNNTLQLLCDLLNSNPSQRPSAAECLRNPCFNSMQHHCHT